MNFKEQAAMDVFTTFFNLNEFTDVVVIDGVQRAVQIDDDHLKKRADKEYFGVTSGMLLYFIPMLSYGPKKPKIGAEQIFNNKLFWIEDVREADGVYEILLNQNRGE